MILPDDFWVRIKPVQRLHQRLYAAGMGWVIGWFVLLLTHTGRKSGKRYLTPLQYEKINGAYYVGAGAACAPTGSEMSLLTGACTYRLVVTRSTAWPSR